MKSDLQIFNNTEFGTLSVLILNGKEMFPATECAKLLGYNDPYNAIKRHIKGSVKHPVLTAGGKQYINFITEGNLYRLIVHSKLPSAERFECWIFDEVLPSIRKHGIYATEDVLRATLKDPAYIIGVLTEFQKEQAAHKATTALLEEKAIQLDESKEWLTVKRVASMNGVNWRDINWKNLICISAYMSIPVKKVFDANYGSVNAYHIDVWKHEYGGFRYGEGS